MHKGLDMKTTKQISQEIFEKNGKKGWVAYRNGELLLREEDFPAAITTADAYRIFTEHCSFLHK